MAINPRINEIENLIDLKQYACPKVKHMNDWYLKCIDCSGLKSCNAGKQAVKLMEMSTATKRDDIPKSVEIPNPKTDLRACIEFVFSRPDPVKEMLMNAGKNIKPQSIYQRVSVWKKNFPELEEKYHMLEKFRFLWSKPYCQMKVPEIIEKMYPAKEMEEDFHGKYDKYELVKEETPMQEEEVALEDILAELVAEDDAPKPKEKVTFDSTAEHYIRKESPEPPRAVTAVGGRSDVERMDILLEKLRKDIAEKEKQIKEIQDQIAAVLTVRKLMENLP